MPLEENPYIVPHFKALISSQNFWGGQRCGSTLSLPNVLLKITILLHNWASDWFHSLLTVYLHFNIDYYFFPKTLHLIQPYADKTYKKN